MNDVWFDQLQQIIERDTGVSIADDKQYFAEARLSPLLSRFEIESLPKLLARATGGQSPDIALAVTEALMTGETFFFRDHKFFDFFRREILADVSQRNADKRSLRIWCAASSTGQEPYSIAMILDEMAAAFSGWRVEIVATDISGDAIERAKSGQYNQFEVQRGLPVTLLLRHFRSEDKRWLVSENIRSRIVFQQENLLAGANQLVEAFDIIFCRNVLMYFSESAREAACNRLLSSLAPDGWLCLGSSEGNVARSDSLRRADPRFPSVFRYRPFDAAPPKSLYGLKTAAE